jgi:hypothetical protein
MAINEPISLEYDRKILERMEDWSDKFEGFAFWSTKHT